MTIAPKPGGVEFRNVSRRYGAVVAVDNVSFVVDPGTLVTLLGPSGCGKTTTLRMIAGLESASSGTIMIGGKDVTRLPATDRNVTMVFQSYALFPHMTVLENVGFGLEVSPLSRSEREARSSEGLRLVGLAGYEKRLPSELSGGQQQRVAVARALVLEPEVLLFDEPLSNLDAKLRRRMRDDIRDLQRSLGLTSVYVTHDQEEALAVSDRIIVMNRAVIAQEGSPRDLYQRPADRFVADFIGGANLIDGVVTGRDGPTATVRVGAMTLDVQAPGIATGDVVVAVRPQAIRVEPVASDATLEVTVRKATYLGSHMEYALDSAVGELFAVDQDVSRAVSTGSLAHVRFDPRGIALVGR
ncbi:ABC transporter ATP-binding protein [Chthonobacter albigriseus]|uniref:ABC transporter ATP-binding protein n=1 Tax=Chthonobacter albigriseus TaxID=1683161 RepID=UPI0015EF36C0|nr:ABC transporter ATP-binding protein [Chthonobacter albigriseus]